MWSVYMCEYTCGSAYVWGPEDNSVESVLALGSWDGTARRLLLSCFTALTKIVLSEMALRLNPGPHTCKASSLPLSDSSAPFYA